MNANQPPGWIDYSPSEFHSKHTSIHRVATMVLAALLKALSTVVFLLVLALAVFIGFLQRCVPVRQIA
jgi:hypothetical protein